MIYQKWTRNVAVLGIAAMAFGACSDDDDGGTGPAVDPLATPTGVTAVAADDDLAISASWTAVADAEEYVVTFEEGGNQAFQEVVSGTTSAAEGLLGRTEYTVSVVAQAAGREPSSPGTATATTGSLNEIFFKADGFNNIVADPGFDASVFNYGSQAAPPNFALSGSVGNAVTLPSNGLVPSLDGRSLVQTTYRGAIEPGTPLEDQFHFGWTVWDPQGADSRPADDKPVVDVATVQADRTFFADTIYRLTQPVFVGTDCGGDGQATECNAVTLTVEPGTTVVGSANVNPGIRGAYLVVSRGSRIIADATSGEDRRPTAEEVIVFTSEEPLGQRAREDWGGMIINGQAPLNTGIDTEGEGDSGFYGGNDANDDSGILRGVRIEFAGDDVTPSDQLNGLALQAVGAGTTISYVQIHYNQDDGIEPYGGNVSVDHLVLTGIGDDSIDGTDGYQGFHQFVIIQQRGDRADNGLEISNNGDTEDAAPKSTAVLANITAVGAGAVTGEIAGSGSDNLIQLREGTNYRVYNSVFQGFGEGFCIRDAVSIENALNRLDGQTSPTSTLSAEGLIIWNNGGEGATENNFAPCGGGSS